MHSQGKLPLRRPLVLQNATSNSNPPKRLIIPSHNFTLAPSTTIPVPISKEHLPVNSTQPLSEQRKIVKVPNLLSTPRFITLRVDQPSLIPKFNGNFLLHSRNLQSKQLNVAKEVEFKPSNLSTFRPPKFNGSFNSSQPVSGLQQQGQGTNLSCEPCCDSTFQTVQPNAIPGFNGALRLTAQPQIKHHPVNTNIEATAVQPSTVQDVQYERRQQIVEEVLPTAASDTFINSETLVIKRNLVNPLKDHNLIQARTAAGHALSAAAADSFSCSKQTGNTQVHDVHVIPADDSSSSENECEVEVDLASESEDETYVDEYSYLKKDPPELEALTRKSYSLGKDKRNNCDAFLNKNYSKPNRKSQEKVCSGTDSESDLSDSFVPRKHKTSQKRLDEGTDTEADLSDAFIITKDVSKKKLNCARGEHVSNTAACEKVLHILPKDYDYKLLSVHEISDGQFATTFRVNVSEVEKIQEWKDSFEMASNTNFRVMHTRKPKTSDRILYKKTFRCHHNTLAEKSKSKKPHEKHIQCASTMTITLKNCKMKRSQDVLVKSHPLEVRLNSNHNHSTDEAAGDILRHRRPCLETIKNFTELFTNTSARISSANAMDRNLEELEGNDPNLFKVGDGAYVPERSWVYKLYHKIMKDKCGDPYGPGMLSALQKYIEQYNTECGDTCAKLGSSGDGQDHYIAICSPMMKRIHNHYKGSGEVMFIDSSGCMDNNNARVFVMLTPSVVCGLPLGMLITFSEREDIVTAALKLWTEVIPQKAFHGRGLQGPKIIISDDSSSERNSLHSCFPDTMLLLCLFHVLQAMWRYIWDSNHGVKFEHKAHIYYLFREIIYASNVEKFHEAYEAALQDKILLSYPIVKKHFEDLKLRAEEWALCYRVDLLTRGHHTNNFCEACMRVIKDSILHRSRAYNTVQLLDLLLSKLDVHFRRKLAFVVNNRIRASRSYKYRIKLEKLKPLMAEKLFASEHLFKVVNVAKKTEYIVDSLLEICSCPVGMCGAPCKHQMAVTKKFHVSHTQFLPTSDPAFRMVLFYIMTGHTNVPDGFLKTLKGNDGDVDLSGIIKDLQEDTHTDDTTGQTEAPSPPQDTPLTDVTSLKENVYNVVGDLCQKLQTSLYLSEPCHKFVKNYWSIVNRGNFESTLASALATFGKDQTALVPLSKQKIIPLQPTALSRRTVFKQGAKQAQPGGRPNKEVSRLAEHGYSAGKRLPASQPSWAVPPVKRSKVPHSLSQCIDAKVRLPK